MPTRHLVPQSVSRRTAMRVVVVVVALFSSALVPSVARANGAVRVPPLPSVGVLKSLVPSGPATVSYLTGPDGRVTTNPTGATRHTLAVGRLVDNYGTGVDIVEQRLYVFTQTGEDASAMLARTHGSVVDEQTITPPVGAGPSTTWTMSTIIVSMKNVVTTTLRQDLRTLDARARGWMKVSDPNLLRTVAIAAHEAAMFHTRVSLDFRANSTSIADGSTTEAASSNAFTWDGYTRRPTDVLRTGVVESWQALDIASKAGPVDVVVSDGGFVPGREVPMTVDPPSAINVNPAKCGGNSLCPWHGTGTAATIGGVVDNHLGAAGTGAPVVRMHAESMAADLWGAISQASKTGSFIINTSWRAVIPALVAFSLEPITSLVRFYYAMGIVIVASAGNDSIDVDAHDCSSTCWETSVTYPCELSDVICVGAVEPSDGSKSGYSNYGSLQRSTKDGAAQDDGSVDIYAPGTTQITGLPSTATLPAATNDNVVSTFSGTSAAAPFVTGVLALMQAADPSLRGQQLLDALVSSARTWTTVQPNDALVVDAYAAISKELRPIAPRVTLISVQPGSITGTDVPLLLSARVDDVADGMHCCADKVNWYADGVYQGKGQNVTVQYSTSGTHLIEATYTNSDGVTGSDSRYLVVSNGPPALELVHPGIFDYPAGLPVLLQARTDFPQNWGRTVSCTWTSSTGESISLGSQRGCVGTFTFTTPGRRILTVTARDVNDGTYSTRVQDICVAADRWDCNKQGSGHSSVVSPLEYSLYSVGDVIDVNAFADPGHGNDSFEWKWYAGDGSQAVTIHPSSYMFSAPWMGVGAGQWNTTGLPQSETGLGWLCYRDITPAPNSVEYIFSTDCVRLTINVPFQ